MHLPGTSAAMSLPIENAAAAGITLRPCVEADLPFIADLYVSTRAGEFDAMGWPAEMQRAFLLSQHAAQHRHYRAHYPDAHWSIIERGDERIGRFYWHATSRELHVIDISLLPQHRGGGIGGALLIDLIAHAETQGKDVSLQVEKHNRARNLYHRLGFAKTADDGVYETLRRPSGV